MTGHMPIKQENTDLLYFNTLFITKSYIAEVYTVQRTVFHTSLYLQNTLLYIKELKGKWLQPPQASNKARILYRQYRDAFERAIHTLKKSVITGTFIYTWLETPKHSHFRSQPLPLKHREGARKLEKKCREKERELRRDNVILWWCFLAACSICPLKQRESDEHWQELNE